MKRLNEQAAAACFRVNVTNRSEGHTAAGVEHVHQPLPFAVASELFLEGPKHLGGDWLKLKSVVL